MKKYFENREQNFPGTIISQLRYRYRGTAPPVHVLPMANVQAVVDLPVLALLESRSIGASEDLELLF